MELNLFNFLTHRLMHRAVYTFRQRIILFRRCTESNPLRYKEQLEVRKSEGLDGHERLTDS